MGVAHPHARHPLHRRLPGLGLEAAVQGADADRGVRRDFAQREAAVHMLFDPGQYIIELGALCNAPGGDAISHDELCLPAAAGNGAAASRAASAATAAP